MSLHYKGLFDDWEIAVTKNLVRQFKSTCPCLNREFVDDLTDECLKHWFVVRDKYDLQKIEKPKSFLAQVVSNKLSDLVRSRLRKKRDKYFEAISLNQFLEKNSDSPFLADPSQQSPADEADLSELKSKLDQAFKKLSPQQKKVYSALRDGQLTITEISVHLKVHRSTVHNEIKRIREIFESEGLRKYLP